MSTLSIPELGTTQDFEWDKKVLDYVFDKWAETDPAKGSALIDDSDKAKLRFRVGFPDTNQSYEITVLQTETVPTGWSNGASRAELNTTLEFTLRMKRINRDKPDLQLLKMEMELMRIAMVYSKTFPRGITGAKDLMWGGMSRQYTGTETFAKSDWRSIARIIILWEIQVV